MDVRPATREKIILSILVLLLLGGVIWRVVELRSPAPEIVLQATGHNENAFAEEPGQEIIVHLAGAVENPGVYHLPEGARVYELLAMGGGLCPQAEGDRLNQARPLMDGERVYVPRAGEEPSLREPGGEEGRININTAGVQELSTLPGIGEVRAGQIVAHREEHGYFRDPAEIMDVGGIGESTYNNIAGLITIY